MAAALPEATLSLSTTTAELGKPVAAVATAPAALEPDLQRSTTDAYAISLAGEAKPAANGTKEWPLQIIPLAVGPLSVTLYWSSSTAVAQAALAVTEPAGLAPDAEVSDIKAPAAAKPRLWPWLLLLAGIAAALYAWRRWKNRPKALAAETAPPDTRTPVQRAMQELADLERSELWGESRYKEFYFQLTEILRGYLERRYGMPALKLTTYELSRQLRQAETERQAVSLFKELFDRADLVKFAKTTPQGGQGGLDVAAARRFVELTAPSPMPTPAAPGGAGGRP